MPLFLDGPGASSFTSAPHPAKGFGISCAQVRATILMGSIFPKEYISTLEGCQTEGEISLRTDMSREQQNILKPYELSFDQVRLMRRQNASLISLDYAI
jgi:hypothetical protein